jgi:hypothetical protein
MVNKRSQKDVVYKHLTRRRSLTSLEAWNLYGIVRLAAVIYDLRRAGYEVLRDKCVQKDALGREHFIARYRLV